jgi:hypothetical protein
MKTGNRMKEKGIEDDVSVSSGSFAEEVGNAKT